MAYRCVICGELHEDPPDIGFGKPDHWFDVPENEREQQIKADEDTCVIDDQDFFIRGVIEIRIHDHPEKFGFGVWVSLKRQHFQTYLENFHSDQIGPFFGWLCTSIDYYDQPTLTLKTMVHFQGGQDRPLVVLEPTLHPLAVAQREGITLEQAWKIIHHYL